MPQNSNNQNHYNPNENLEIPKWINAAYFNKILENNVPNFKQIINLTPVAVTPPGENYTSIMVRVFIEIELNDGTLSETSYILKTTIDPESQTAAIVNNLLLFPKEKQMYKTILPAFEQLYKNAGVDIKIGPKCLHIEDTPERVTIVMEDLKLQKFSNIDRLKGLDLVHMRTTLRKLAEYHAASAVYYELYGSYDEMFTITLYTESNRKFFEGIAKEREELYRKAMRQWGLEDVENYINYLPNIDEFFDEGIRMNTINTKQFNVLNHGDFWSNNIMFRYKENNEKEIDETMFVDFQIGNYGTPAQDLWYLIANSAALDIKIKEFDHFIQIYQERLVECLKLLKYTKPMPTLKQLHIMMITYSFWGYAASNTVLCAILFPSDANANMENFIKSGPEGDEFRYKTFVNPIYVKAMLQLFPFFKVKGVFEFRNTT